MAQVVLVSSDTRPIRSLVESAILDKARALEMAILQTEGRIHQFEENYGWSTNEFLRRFAQNEFDHTCDFDDWIGESRMLTRLRERHATLKDIKIAD